MKLDLLAILAHPDDAELSCSGTLMVEKNRGQRVGIVDLTRGELGTRGTPELRLKEAAAARQIMNLDVRENLGMADGFFSNDETHRLKIISVIRKYQPGIIITNAPSDRHPDHGRAAGLVKDAAWLSGLRKIETSLEGKTQEAWRPAYVFHCIQDRYLKPDFVIDISGVMDQKMAAIRAFSSQFDTVPDSEPQTYISTPAFLQSVAERCREFGKSIGVAYAEGFISEKIPGHTSLNSFIRNVT